MKNAEFENKLLAIIDENYLVKGFDVPKLADLMGFTQRTLHRQCKKYLSASPVEIIRRYRIGKAKVLLLEGMTTKNAAIRVGYQTETAFLKAFKKETGMSPGAYKSGAKSPDQQSLLKQICSHVGQNIDPNSDEQVKQVLRDELNIYLPQKPSLEESLSFAVSDHAILKLIKLYRATSWS